MAAQLSCNICGYVTTVPVGVMPRHKIPGRPEWCDNFGPDASVMSTEYGSLNY